MDSALEIAAIVSSITGLVAVAASGFSAFAAWRSAQNAEKSAEQAEEVFRVSRYRDALGNLQKIAAETLQIDDLANELKLSYKNSFALAGQSGGGRQKMYVDAVERKQKDIGPIQSEILGLLEETEEIRTLPTGEMTDLLAKLDGYLVYLYRVKEKFQRELASIEKNTAELRLR